MSKQMVKEEEMSWTISDPEYDQIREGDRCPECGDGIIVLRTIPAVWLGCDNCGARWNDKGQRVACGDM